jgi:hypothetical protein
MQAVLRPCPLSRDDEPVNGISTNTLGTIFVSDVDNHCIGSVDNHNPARYSILAGGVDAPGHVPSATATLCSGKDARFWLPSGLAVLHGGGVEHLIVADTGNLCLKRVSNVHRAASQQKVALLQCDLRGKKPYALTVVSHAHDAAVIAFTGLGDKGVYHLQLDASGFRGHISVVVLNDAGFSEPRGLTFRGGSELCIADGRSIKLVDLASKVVTVLLPGAFEEAVGIAASASGSLGVTDRKKNTVTFTSAAGQIERVIGTGEQGAKDGPWDYAEFDEPIGIAFDGRTALIAHFGGSTCGSLRQVVHTAGAVEYLAKQCSLYECAHYIPRRVQNNPHARAGLELRGFGESIAGLEEVEAFYMNFCSARETVLQRKTQGPEGTPYHLTIAGLTLTVESLKVLQSAFDPLIRARFSMRAFINESLVEHSFADRRVEGRSDHPTMAAYGAKKGQSDLKTVKRLCTSLFSVHASRWTAYQAPHKADIKAETVIAALPKRRDRPKVGQLSDDVRSELKSAKASANLVARAGAPQAAQNPREKYRQSCGFAPTILVFQGAASDPEAGPAHPGFEEIVLRIQLGQPDDQEATPRIQGASTGLNRFESSKHA